MKLLFLKYANNYKSNRILFLNLNLYQIIINNQLRNLLFIVYYLF